MIPRTLDEWNIDVIKHLLAQGYYEAETFDFKEMLPDSRNEVEKLGLSKTCCAFANSSGGFLVFGVKDAKAVKAGEDRLQGFSPNYDFPEQFGSYPQKCSPGIAWDFKNPPISLNNGNVLHVILILRSWNAPHCLEIPGKGSDHLRCFTKRTNKGNEDMSYEEIRMSFLQYYEKRLKLQLLRAELQTIKDNAVRLRRHGESAAGPPPLGEFSLTVLETTLADTYTIIMSNILLLDHLKQIRNMCGQVNNKLQSILPVYHMPMSDPKTIFLKHNTDVTNFCEGIISTAQSALQELDEIISEK